MSQAWIVGVAGGPEVDAALIPAPKPLEFPKPPVTEKPRRTDPLSSWAWKTTVGLRPPPSIVVTVAPPTLSTVIALPRKSMFST